MELNDKYMLFVVVSYLIVAASLTIIFGGLDLFDYYSLMLAIGFPMYLVMKVHYVIKRKGE